MTKPLLLSWLLIFLLLQCDIHWFIWNPHNNNNNNNNNNNDCDSSSSSGSGGSSSSIVGVQQYTIQAFTIPFHDYSYHSTTISNSKRSSHSIHQQTSTTLSSSSSSSSSSTTTSDGSFSSTSSSLSSVRPQQQQQQQLLDVSETCQLAQLSKMTTISIDCGDIDLIQLYASTGYITDATTNPLFVAQTAFKTTQEQPEPELTDATTTTTTTTTGTDGGNSIYSQMVNDAVAYAIEKLGSNTDTSNQQSDRNDDELPVGIVALSMDRLAVNLGAAIAQITPGYISTEVDPRLSYNIDASISRALQIVAMYENDYHISKDRILIKLAATWEGIMAAQVLQSQYNIQCNLTLIFSIVQGIACAQYNIHLISPFPGRILDYYNTKLQRKVVIDPTLDDEGVIACTYLHNYFKYYNHTTICMPASWRPSRGSSGGMYELDEIQALAGTDRMTIPVPLLAQLIQNEEPLPRKLFPYDHSSEESSSSSSSSSSSMPSPPPPPVLLGNGQITEIEFRYLLCMDGCGNDKLAEGLRSFCQLTEQLEVVMTEKVRAAMFS